MGIDGNNWEYFRRKEAEEEQEKEWVESKSEKYYLHKIVKLLESINNKLR
jgi:hypothetical protein